MVEQCASQEKSICWRIECAAIHANGRALRHAAINVAAHFVAMLGSNQWPHFRFGIHAVANHNIFHFWREFGDEFVRHFVAHYNRDGNRHAALTRRAISRAHQGICRHVQIRIGHNQHVIFRAAQRLHALVVIGCGCVNIFGDGRGADKADGLDFGVMQQCVHRHFIAMHHVKHTVRQARFFHQFGKVN